MRATASGSTNSIDFSDRPLTWVKTDSLYSLNAHYYALIMHNLSVHVKRVIFIKFYFLLFFWCYRKKIIWTNSIHPLRLTVCHLFMFIMFNYVIFLFISILFMCFENWLYMLSFFFIGLQIPKIMVLIHNSIIIIHNSTYRLKKGVCWSLNLLYLTIIYTTTKQLV